MIIGISWSGNVLFYYISDSLRFEYNSLSGSGLLYIALYSGHIFEVTTMNVNYHCCFLGLKTISIPLLDSTLRLLNLRSQFIFYLPLPIKVKCKNYCHCEGSGS